MEAGIERSNGRREGVGLRGWSGRSFPPAGRRKAGCKYSPAGSGIWLAIEEWRELC
jgi:hypothetical protein